MRFAEFTSLVDSMGYEKTAGLASMMGTIGGAVKGFAKGFMRRTTNARAGAQIGALKGSLRGKDLRIAKLTAEKGQAQGALEAMQNVRGRTAQRMRGLRGQVGTLQAQNTTLTSQVGNRTRDLGIAGGIGLGAGILGTKLMSE